MSVDTNESLLKAIESLNRMVAVQTELLEETREENGLAVGARDIEFKYQAGEINLDELFRRNAEEALSKKCPDGDFRDEIISYHIGAQIAMLKRDVFSFSQQVALCLEALSNKVFQRTNRNKLNSRSKSIKNGGVTGLEYVWSEKSKCFKLENKYLNSLAFKLPEMEKLFNPLRNTEFGIIESLEQFSKNGKQYLLLSLSNSRYDKVITIYESTLAVGKSILYYVNTLFFDEDKKAYELILVSKKVEVVTSHNLSFYKSRVFLFGNGKVGKLNWVITTLRNYQSHGSFKSLNLERVLIQQVKSGNFEKSRFFYECMTYLNEFISKNDIYDYVN